LSLSAQISIWAKREVTVAMGQFRLERDEYNPQLNLNQHYEKQMSGDSAAGHDF
jgi:hypothetical protein